MASTEAVSRFFREDSSRTLFPLETNCWLIEHGLDTILKYIHEEITCEESVASGDFQQQERVYAAKHGHHLRRTHKLDPVAEAFVYDIVYRHRSKFRKDVFAHRTTFGYRFENGEPLSSSVTYRDYRTAVSSMHTRYRFSCSFDISAYFNSIYHHDLSHWFEGIGNRDSDAKFFGKFFRQINGGRSVDCVPHGLYPTKMIGSHFLNFVDTFPEIEAPAYLRFMDDFVLFSDDLGKLQRDFIRIQELLGQKVLSVNPAKTKFRDRNEPSVKDPLDKIREGLLRRHTYAFRSLYSDTDAADVDPEPQQAFLTEEEEEYLLGLLDSPQLEEEDAELVLAYLRDKAEDLLEHISTILWRFPYLSKSICLFSRFIDDKAGLLNALLEFVRQNDVVSDYSLFWTARILDEHLLGVPGVESLVAELMGHPRASRISKAKILEICDQRYGLREYRQRILGRGGSDWLSWSSAVGCREENKTSRNHLMKYFANGSRLNALIAEIVQGS